MDSVEELSFYEVVGIGQIIRLGMIIVGGVGVLIAGWLWPSFFQYHYWYFAGSFFEDVWRFWPAFAWAIVINLFVCCFGDLRSDFYDERLLRRGLITSIGAGVTEEAWFRGVGVFYAMVSLMILNWIFGAAAWVFIVAASLGVLATLASIPLMWSQITAGGLAARLFGIVATSLVIYAFLHYQNEPVTHLYQDLFYPIINFVALGHLTSVFHGDHQPLLVMGMISANFAFRDGHKYQGFVGYTNAWWMGCVFVFATLTYGLPVAIAVHAVVDVLIDVLIYAGKKIRG